MLRNYLAVSIRNLSRNKGYAFINVAKRAVGLACFILILLFVQHELSYDRFHVDADRIHRVVRQQPGKFFLGSDYFAVAPAPLAGTLVREYPEVVIATTIGHEGALLRVGENHLWEDGDRDPNTMETFECSRTT